MEDEDVQTYHDEKEKRRRDLCLAASISGRNETKSLGVGGGGDLRRRCQIVTVGSLVRRQLEMNHSTGVTSVHLEGTYQLPLMETESWLCRWPEIAKPSPPAPAPANTNGPHPLSPLPTENSPLHTHSTLQTPLPQRSLRQPGGTAVFSQFHSDSPP